MFSPSTYSNRRNDLLKHFTDGVLVFLGNDELAMNYTANPYTFRQDSTFLYYFGIDLPGMHALIDVDNEASHIFGTECTLDDIIWSGVQPSLADWKKRTAAAEVHAIDKFGEYVLSAIKQGRSVHFLPAYRTEHENLLQQLTGKNRLEPSEQFIKAVVAQRSIKTADEIDEIEKAHAITYKMQTTAMQMAREGIIEREIYGRIEGIALSKGAQISFPVILSKNGQILHNHRHDNVIQNGDILINDCGAESLEHYAADITRTIPVSGSFTQQQKEIYQIVLNAQETAIDAIKPGRPFREIHLIAAHEIASGLKELGIMKGDMGEAVEQGAHALFFPHGLGHMMGLDVHDMENLGEHYVGYDGTTERSSQFGLAALRLAKPLEPGYVVTVEPGIYFIPALIEQWRTERKCSDFINYNVVDTYLQFGGVRIEDDILVTGSGFRILGETIPKTIAAVESACQI